MPLEQVGFKRGSVVIGGCRVGQFSSLFDCEKVSD